LKNQDQKKKMTTTQDVVTRLEYEYKIRKNTIKDKFPMRGSNWLKSLHQYVNLTPNNTKGELLRSSLLSGGTIHCSRETYLNHLQLKADDILGGVILTDNEIVHNSEGFLAYFEVDWSDAQRLPTEAEIEVYIRSSQDAMKECYPAVENFEVRVLRNLAHLKYKDQTELAMGLHLIFPGITTKTEENLLVAQLLDNRISRKDPIWSGKTDFSSYHESCANLRPCFARKMPPCPTCDLKSALEGKSKKKRKLNNENTDQTEQKVAPTTLSLQSLTCSECFGGKIIDTNFYTLKYILHDNGTYETIREGRFSVSEIVYLTSIVTLRPQAFSVLRKPAEIGTILDIVQPDKLGLLAPSSFNRLKGKLVNECENTAAYIFINKIIIRMIANFNSEYATVVSHKLLMRSQNSAKANLIATIKGRGARFCLLNKSEHTNNGVYFILNRRGVLSFHCHNIECKEKLKHQKIEMGLTKSEKEDCQKILKFCGETPVTGVEPPPADTWNPNNYKTKLTPKTELDKIMEELNQEEDIMESL
jgi:hypothetical protein